MPRRASIKRTEDVNQSAFRTVQELTRDADEAPSVPEPLPTPKQKNPAAVALGRLGASKGGKARAAKLSDSERSEIARTAARKRWGEGKSSRD